MPDTRNAAARLCRRDGEQRRYNRSVLLLGATLFTLAKTAPAQSPLAIENVGNGGGVQANALGVNNPWAGAQLFWRAPGGSGSSFGEQLAASGTIMYDIPLVNTKLHLPVIGNLSTLIQPVKEGTTPQDAADAESKQLLASEAGLNVGLAPYYVYAESPNVKSTIHGEMGWRLNGLAPVTGASSSNKDLIYLHQLRVAVGVDALIGDRGKGHSLLSVSAGPVVSFFSSSSYLEAFGRKRSMLAGFEMNIIVPIHDGIGFLADGVVGSSAAQSFRVGLVAAGQAQ